MFVIWLPSLLVSVHIVFAETCMWGDGGRKDSGRFSSFIAIVQGSLSLRPCKLDLVPLCSTVSLFEHVEIVERATRPHDLLFKHAKQILITTCTVSVPNQDFFISLALKSNNSASVFVTEVNTHGTHSTLTNTVDCICSYSCCFHHSLIILICSLAVYPSAKNIGH